MLLLGHRFEFFSQIFILKGKFMRVTKWFRGCLPHFWGSTVPPIIVTIPFLHINRIPNTGAILSSYQWRLLCNVTLSRLALLVDSSIKSSQITFFFISFWKISSSSHRIGSSRQNTISILMYRHYTKTVKGKNTVYIRLELSCKKPDSRLIQRLRNQRYKNG